MTQLRRSTEDGMTLRVYRGDGCALLAFDLRPELAPDLAGFAVEVTDPRGRTSPVLNRLSFTQAVTAATTPGRRRWTPTTEAPLQKFHWVHFPADVRPGLFTFKATAMLFKAGSETAIERGPSTSVRIELFDEGHERFDVGFSRGFLSSQAYADRFHNAPVQPARPTIDFPTAEYEQRWRWLGFHARRLVFDFLAETIADPKLNLDVFAYDLDEPDVVRALQQLGPRLRLYLDDSKDHVKAGAPELDARRLLEASAGPANVKVGHFGRFSHDKVLIQRRGKTPRRVLSGSANFSVRGFYVQSNNVFVFRDRATAELYARAFDQTWSDAAGFERSTIAGQWFDRTSPGLPRFAVSFAPHAKSEVSLRRVADAIEGAKSSVLFSIMQIGGTGPVLDAVRRLRDRPELYAFGTTQNRSGDFTVDAPGSRPIAVPFAYLKSSVPKPFSKEISGGIGQVIHHKFVVVDFNGAAPVVFAGSSNLAAGGETLNGDNLLAFTDWGIAETYAVEAIRLIDHYRFRAVQQRATSSEPLRLKMRSEQWAADSYKPGHPKERERLLFVG